MGQPPESIFTKDNLSLAHYTSPAYGPRETISKTRFPRCFRRARKLCAPAPIHDASNPRAHAAIDITHR